MDSPDELHRLRFDDADGFDIALRSRTSAEHGEVFELVVNGVFAMDSVDASSEVALADLVDDDARRVLIGGLGLGFTANALLDRLPEVVVDVAELSGGLVRWAGEGLVPTLTRLHDDPRCTLVHTDVTELLREGAVQYDAILLDVDNGPDFLIHDHNSRLYREDVVAATLRRLSPGGLLAVWCEAETPSLAAALASAGDETGVVTVPVERDGHRVRYAIHCARRRR